MKNKTIYFIAIIFIFVLLGILGLLKGNYLNTPASASLLPSGEEDVNGGGSGEEIAISPETFCFDPLLGKKVCFTLSIDKTSYIVGETITAKVTATESLIFSSYYYDGTLTIKSTGSGNVLFSHSYSGVLNIPSSYPCLQNPSETSSSPLCLSNILFVKIPPETLPGEYNATLSITKTFDIFGLITKTKKVSIPFTIFVRDSFKIDPPGPLNMKVGDKIQLKALYDRNIDDSIPAVDVTSLTDWLSSDPTVVSMSDSIGTIWPKNVKTLAKNIINKVFAVDKNLIAYTSQLPTPADYSEGIFLYPPFLTFTGISGGTTPAPQTLTIKNITNNVLVWKGDTDSDWCHISPSSDRLAAGASQDISVSVDAPSNIGSFECVITISDSYGKYPSESASVTYNVSPLRGVIEAKAPGKAKITATYNGKTASVDITVSALPTPPPGNFTLSLNGSAGCNFVPLKWTSSSNAYGYRILKGSQRIDISPYQPYTDLTFIDNKVNQNTTYQYQIEAYNTNGTNRSNEIKITTPYCPPIVDLSVDHTSIYQGQTITLTWTSSYANSCTASASPAQSDWTGTKPLNNTIGEVVKPESTSSITYTLSCSGPSGSASDSVTIGTTSLPKWKEVIPR